MSPGKVPGQRSESQTNHSHGPAGICSTIRLKARLEFAKLSGQGGGQPESWGEGGGCSEPVGLGAPLEGPTRQLHGSVSAAGEDLVLSREPASDRALLSL